MHHILLNNLLILVATCLNSNQALLKLTCFVRKKIIMVTYNGLGIFTKQPCLVSPKSTLCFLLLLHTGCSQTPTNSINHHSTGVFFFYVFICFKDLAASTSKTVQRWLLCCFCPATGLVEYMLYSGPLS